MRGSVHPVERFGKLAGSGGGCERSPEGLPRPGVDRRGIGGDEQRGPAAGHHVEPACGQIPGDLRRNGSAIGVEIEEGGAAGRETPAC